jgi:hypothetical protein
VDLDGVANDPLSPEPALLDDDAVVISAELPTALDCGASAEARVTVENRGALTWTADSHKLGAVDDEDALFAGGVRVYLPQGASVVPGAQHTFTMTLRAPAGLSGSLRTDWRMVHEGVTWFGETAFSDVLVICEGLPPASLTLPDRKHVVEAVAAERPDLFAAHCVEQGGNNDFLHAVVDRLRLEDTRWGYNWKRGHVGSLSQDVIDYYRGDGEPEGSTDVFLVDIIVSMCSPESRPGWIDVTQATIDGGTVGMWTSLDRF